MASRGRTVVRRLIIGALAVFGALVLAWGCMIGCYMQADSEYRRLTARHPRTRAEVESVVGRWPHYRIEREDSHIGRHFGYVGEYVQYSMFGAPIDVVYDASDRVVVILPSYE